MCSVSLLQSVYLSSCADRTVSTSICPQVNDCGKAVQVFLATAKRVGGELSDGIDAAKALA